VLSVQPLTAYLYKGGMARFATNKYRRPTEANLGDVYMHLTNYSLNKRNTGAYVQAKGRRAAAGLNEGSGEESEDSSDDGYDAIRASSRSEADAAPDAALPGLPDVRTTAARRARGCRGSTAAREARPSQRATPREPRRGVRPRRPRRMTATRGARRRRGAMRPSALWRTSLTS
jgi:hypothetical protein